MITKNGKEMLGQATNGYIRAKFVNGGVNAGNFYRTNFENYPFFCVGSGTAQPTVDDYCLESQINSLTQLCISKSNGSSYDSNYIITAQATFKNNTEQNITVNEVGFFLSGNGEWIYSVLIAREVLDAPVVIRPQQTYTFSITI